VLVQRGSKSSIYSVMFEGEQETEFDKFLTDPEVTTHSNFEELLAQIDEIINRYGCQTRFFKPESSASDSVEALWRGNLRLYCCKYGHIILILGSGGVKRTRTYQEDPKLDQIVKMMAKVSNLVDEKIKEREIWYEDNMFRGDLTFSVEE